MCAPNISLKTVPQKFNVVVTSYSPSPHRNLGKQMVTGLTSAVQVDALDTVNQFHKLVKYYEKFTPERVVDRSTLQLTKF